MNTKVHYLESMSQFDLLVPITNIIWVTYD